MDQSISEGSVTSRKSLGGRLAGRVSGKDVAGRKLPFGRQLLLQVLLIIIAISVLYPIVWVFSLSLDPRNVNRPTTLNLIPQGASFKAYRDVMTYPTSNKVTFTQLALNSTMLAGGVALVSLLIGVSAAYAFSRFKFPGRQILMLGVVTVLMLPGIATIAPLYVLLNHVQVHVGNFNFNLRDSLWGVGMAMISGGLPFAIWNLKGYIDTIPKELEEAAIIDGASPAKIFFSIMLPLSTPALAVVGFLGFMGGWTEFALSWQFLTHPQNYTLTMTLWNMTGQFADNTPWSRFAAMSILIALPVSVVYLLLQRYIVGGLTLGGVKG